MKQKTLLVVAAAAAVTAIVVLTTGAFAGTPGRSDQPGDGVGAFVSCLASHGVQVPSNDPAAVKRWLADRQNDPAVQAALQACQQPDGTEPGPTPAALVTCIQQHGVHVPSGVKENPDALKPWLHGAMHQPSVKGALDACLGGPANGQKK